jgi:hypothetical protein
MRIPGLTTATSRIIPMPLRASAFPLLALGSAITAIVEANTQPRLAIISGLAVLPLLRSAYTARKRGTWTVTIAPDGTITSRLHDPRLRCTLSSTLNLADVISARAGISAVRTATGVPGQVVTSMDNVDLLVLSTTTDSVGIPRGMLLANPPLLAALRTHTIGNTALTSAPLTSREAIRASMLVGTH